MELQTLFTENPRAARMKLVAEIAAACGASRPTVKSVTESSGNLYFKTTIKTAKESDSETLMTSMGFTRQNEMSTKGSTFGDFSSDIYGTIWIHGLGITVAIFSSFKFNPATFNIHLAVR